MGTFVVVDDAVAYLRDTYGIRRTAATLNKLRVVGGGPDFRRVGSRNIAYERAALDSWARSLISEPLTSTSSYRAS